MTRVIVNGTFDIVHTGHIKLLNYAKSLGDYLLVCIDTDRRVRELKGITRPINSQEDRALLLLNLKAVDKVLFFDTDQDLENIFKEYDPDLMVKGGDYRNKPYVGQQYCKSTVYYDRIEPYSTTAAIQHIANRR
jgi:D-beta-D-heptose 7-phosphate kinase/D-beta-D-heptose 1-phosphate adenosyltransferase